MAHQIVALTQINNFPERTLPQERFDDKVKVTMQQLTNMVTELNTLFIPATNNISSTVDAQSQHVDEMHALVTDLKGEVVQNVQHMDEVDPAGQADAAAQSASEAASSAAAAAQSALDAQAIAGITIATTEVAGIVAPDGETIGVDSNGKIRVLNEGISLVIQYAISNLQTAVLRDLNRTNKIELFCIDLGYSPL